MPAKKSAYVERITAWEKELDLYRSAARTATPRHAGQIMRDWHKANPYPQPDAPKKKKSVKKEQPLDVVPETVPDEGH